MCRIARHRHTAAPIGRPWERPPAAAPTASQLPPPCPSGLPCLSPECSRSIAAAAAADTLSRTNAHCRNAEASQLLPPLTPCLAPMSQRVGAHLSPRRPRDTSDRDVAATASGTLNGHPFTLSRASCFWSCTSHPSENCKALPGCSAPRPRAATPVQDRASLQSALQDPPPLWQAAGGEAGSGSRISGPNEKQATATNGWQRRRR